MCKPKQPAVRTDSTNTNLENNNAIDNSDDNGIENDDDDETL